MCFLNTYELNPQTSVPHKCTWTNLPELKPLEEYNFKYVLNVDQPHLHNTLFDNPLLYIPICTNQKCLTNSFYNLLAYN